MLQRYGEEWKCEASLLRLGSVLNRREVERLSTLLGFASWIPVFNGADNDTYGSVRTSRGLQLFDAAARYFSF